MKPENQTNEQFNVEDDLPRILGYARYLARNTPGLIPVDAYDIAQETCLIAHMKIPRGHFVSQEKFLAWRKGIAQHIAQQIRDAKKGEVFLGDLVPSYEDLAWESHVDAPGLTFALEETLPDLLRSSEPLPDSVLESQELTELLHELLAKLDPKYRQVVERRILKEEDTQTIAKDLGLTQAGVRTRLFRGIRLLVLHAKRVQLKSLSGDRQVDQ